MKKNFQAAYLPIGVGTFHLESAQKLFEASKELISGLAKDLSAGRAESGAAGEQADRTVECAFPDEMLLSLDKLDNFLDTIEPDFIILQNITFANAAYTAEVMRRFAGTPVLLWTLREPAIDGGRLRLNSLTGAYSAANTLKRFSDKPVNYIFGSPDENNVKQALSAALAAARLRYDMKHLNLLAVGHTPEGFGFGRADDNEMMSTFGTKLLSIEARELIDTAKSYSDEEIAGFLKDAENRTVGLQNTPEKNRTDFARLYKAYKDYCITNNIGALASRCWPDFFTAFGTPVCLVLAMLNDLHIPAACEADTYGALSMYAASELTGSPCFFGDPVSMNEEENTITFWHCGTAACSLAREDTGAVIGEHCNRHIGPTCEFGCRASDEATIFRIGKAPDGSFRFFIAEGEILDKPKQFLGTSLVVRTKGSAEEIVHRTVEEAWEPHYVVAYGAIGRALTYLANYLGIEVVRM
ncbi:MAG: fucose isomerase [Lachnospiraceae bacterium]|nr:fucose isomerase [Lachnospiraceae bacterium]